MTIKISLKAIKLTKNKKILKKIKFKLNQMIKKKINILNKTKIINKRDKFFNLIKLQRNKFKENKFKGKKNEI